MRSYYGRYPRGGALLLLTVLKANQVDYVLTAPTGVLARRCGEASSIQTRSVRYPLQLITSDPDNWCVKKRPVTHQLKKPVIGLYSLIALDLELWTNVTETHLEHMILVLDLPKSF